MSGTRYTSPLKNYGEVMTEVERFNRFFKQCHENGVLMNAAELLQQAARRWPHKTALLCQNSAMTYQELHFRATLFSKKLEAAGIQVSDNVIIICENSINFFIAYYGIWQTGAVIVPVNTFLHEHELHHIIQDSHAKAIFVSDKLRSKIAALSLSHNIIFGEQDIDTTTPVSELSYTIKKRNPDDMTALLYTSGTTGLPKGVMLSSRNILTNTAQAAASLDVLEGERIFAALPLFHSYSQNGCLWTGILGGCTSIIIPKIDRTALRDGLEKKPTIIFGIPGLYGLFCHLKNISFNYVKYFVCGGDALPDKIRMGFELIFRRKLCNGYGLTETSPFISINAQDETLPTNTIGKPVVGVHAEIRDEAGKKITNFSSIGTLWVTGDNIMLGYYNAPEATSTILHNGWLNTGDLARYDSHGRIIICGRQKDIIINKGIKIYPQEIENIIMSHPLVTAVGVVGMKDNNEEVPVAYVAVREKTDTLIEELKTLCQQNLAAYKLPRRYFIEHELPTTATGKVDKKVLRAKLASL